MNEEEKKAINNMEKFARVHQDMTAVSAYEMDIVLNLIEKLQKENETLKKFVSGIVNENIEKDFIPVQKIKDKIRHYQELQDNYIKKYDEINEGLQAMINVLQELLEGRSHE